ncbi:hypothetical protein ACEPAH_7291 [Sanghuangporus vaninii]
MPVALHALQNKGSQGRNTSRYAPIHNKVNRSYTFTAKEVLRFLQMEGLVVVAKTIDVVTDADIESIVKSSGFMRHRVEDKMVEIAFETLAPGLLKIPPDNVVKMLEFSKAKKIGNAYKIANNVSWEKLKNALNMKRAEVLEDYRRYLMLGGDMKQHAVDQVPTTTSNFRTTRGRRMSRMNVSAPSCFKPRNLGSDTKHTSFTEIKECHSPSATKSDKDQVEEFQSPKEANDSSGQWTRSRIREAGQTKIPCYVTTRRKKDLKRQNALGNISAMDDNLSEQDSGRTRYFPQNNATGRMDEHVNNTTMIQGRSDVDLEGSAARSAKSARRGYDSISNRTDILDALQLVGTPEDLREPEDFGFSDEDNWTDEVSPIFQKSACAEDPARSGPAESPTTVTLRKLAELREQILEEKRTGVWQQRQRQRQQHDFMNSPDSDYTFSEACRSPRPRQQCTFAFRGLRIEAPAAAERPSRQRHPAWYVREDPGSPTPMRAAVRLESRRQKRNMVVHCLKPMAQNAQHNSTAGI